ncbi:MAG: glycerol-3-phosphate acyltransferase [Lachnospiraceae bacterium]|nr:glycerol-3-phosphate acyltransferase [Lachnospiraceae bacterium]MBQ6857045.1 glycerol-3-phosphate acyltransferase [Lachnospiraceae bacterium]
MDVLLCGLMGYSVGCFNPAYLIGSRKGIDVRKEGSGNAGASNMVLLFGAKAGLITAVLDILKAYFVTSLAACILPACAVAKEVAAAFCVLGHMFPATMKFKGGKGLACMVGGVLAYNKRLFIRLAILEIAAALILDYIIVITISLACILPALYILSGGSLAVGILFAAVGVVVIYKHRANIERIANGTEVRISYLWNREKETKRVKENMDEEEAV